MGRKLGGGNTESSFRIEAKKYQGDINPQTQTSAQIARFLKERNITKLLHFTDKSNLDNILNFGLLSREILDALQWNYNFNDEKRLDRRLDCISLSMSRINKELLDVFIEKKKIDKCVIIAIDASMLYREYNERIYCQTNAATKRAKKGSEFKDLVAMFDDEVSYRRSYDEKHLKRSEQNLNDNKPTAPQAEILWKDWVNPNYIKNVYFYDGESYASIYKDINSNIASEIQRHNNAIFNLDNFNERYKDEVYKDPVKKINDTTNRIRNSYIEVEDKEGNKKKVSAPLRNSNQGIITELERQEKQVSKELKEKQEELVKEQANQKPNEKSDAVKKLEQEIDEIIKKKEDIQNLKKDYEAFEETNQSLLSSKTVTALYNEVGDKLLREGNTKEDFDKVVSKITNAENSEQRKEAVNELIDMIEFTDSMKKEIAKEIAKNNNNTKLN